MRTTFEPRRPTPSRVVSYLKFLFHLAIFVVFCIGALALVQEFWHPFDSILSLVQQELDQIDRKLTTESVAGVSLGGLVLALGVAGASILSRGVHKKQYQVSFVRGLVSSFIFFITDALYRFLRNRGDLYYVAAIALFVGATLVLVEILSRWGSRTAEAERRTEFLASIVSGLTFALIVQACEHLMESMKTFLP